MRLLLIRHAESLGNSERRLQGRREFPLTERGREQSRGLARRLASLNLAALYASPISRARETAGIIAAEVRLDVRQDERLQEYDFGERLSGRTWDEIGKEHPEIIEALRQSHTEFPAYPGEEGREAFRLRVSQALSEIAERHAGGPDVAVVTHGGPIVVYLMDVLGRPYMRPIPFAVDNGSVTTVEFGKARVPGMPEAVIIGLNDTCHLHVAAQTPNTAMDR